jgi:hypothetical protein
VRAHLADDPLHLPELGDTHRSGQLAHPVVDADDERALVGDHLVELLDAHRALVVIAYGPLEHPGVVADDHAALAGRDRLVILEADAPNLPNVPSRFPW